MKEQLYLGYRISRVALLRDRRALACSLAPTLACNLACSFCYSASPRAKGSVKRELTVEGFRELCVSLHRKGIRHATLTDGEPLLNEMSQEKCKVASEVFPNIWIVTNGTHGFPRFRNTLYIVSLDGDEIIHDRVRGKGCYQLIKSNATLYNPSFLNATTLTRMNHNIIEKIIGSSQQLGARGICFSWSTPMSPKDILHLSHAERNIDIDEILRLKAAYGDYIVNTDAELKLMRSNEWSKRCPNWFIESYDAYGSKKPTCVFGKATQFMCDNCGCSVYPSILTVIERRSFPRQIRGYLVGKLRE